MGVKQPLATMPMDWRHYKALICGSMEQLIGAGLSAVAGVVIPMLSLLGHGELSSSLQGLIGATALVGIAIGSPVIGGLSDKYGYAFYYRLCPAILFAAPWLVFAFPSVWVLIATLFLTGFAVGGGYSLDSSYISELMPEKWKQMMVGVAKATSALGFVILAGGCWIILKAFPEAEVWRYLLLLISALGLLTLLMCIGYPDSPRWLLLKGRDAEAQAAARKLFGPDAEVLPLPATKKVKAVGWKEMFKPGPALDKVIFSGVPWAFEGVGVYGIGVFLPVLVMGLGIDASHAVGMQKVVNSVGLTTIINCFIIPGFVIGLWLMNKVWHVRLLTWGFVFYSIGVGIVLAAYLLHWPMWISIAGFLIFEIALNAGPHLITFVIPSQVFSVAELGAGTGIAAMQGKVGAVVGVFLMPVLLKAGGMTLVLIFCIAVGVLGAAVSAIYGRKVLPKGSDRAVA